MEEASRRRGAFFITHALNIDFVWWVGVGSNHRRPKPADLQSAPFSHSGTHPVERARRAVLVRCPANHPKRSRPIAKQTAPPEPAGRRGLYVDQGQPCQCGKATEDVTVATSLALERLRAGRGAIAAERQFLDLGFGLLQQPVAVIRGPRRARRWRCFPRVRRHHARAGRRCARVLSARARTPSRECRHCCGRLGGLRSGR